MWPYYLGEIFLHLSQVFITTIFFRYSSCLPSFAFVQSILHSWQVCALTRPHPTGDFACRVRSGRSDRKSRVGSEVGSKSGCRIHSESCFSIKRYCQQLNIYSSRYFLPKNTYSPFPTVGLRVAGHFVKFVNKIPRIFDFTLKIGQFGSQNGQNVLQRITPPLETDYIMHTIHCILVRPDPT